MRDETNPNGKQLLTRHITANTTEKAAQISWYTNNQTINISISNRGKWSDITLDADKLGKFIKEMQYAYSELTPVNIFYAGRIIGIAKANSGIYTFYATETIDDTAREFARRQVEAMNQARRQVL